MKPALLVIDMQNVSYSGFEKESMDRASKSINEAAGFFREKGFPVVWIQQRSKDAVPGTREFEIIDVLQHIEADKYITKDYLNSFNKTDLFEYIRSQSVDTVLVSGFCAEYCVLSTYRGALDLDLTPFLLKNGTAGGRKEYTVFVETICDVVPLGAMRLMLS
jgi:nicotinamidase-related amidase